MQYSQDAYIESVKGTLVEFITMNVPDAEIVLAFPDITGENFSLVKPVIYIEFERELNIDAQKGKSNGGGKRVKRKILTYSLQVITTGDNRAVMERDRIVQTITQKVVSQYELLSGKGLQKAESKFVGSYRVREGIHLAIVK
ncbi:hypothetical protein [Microcystis phage MaeS]|nr:hypothetical protein [Microcystis phage MaeS]